MKRFIPLFIVAAVLASPRGNTQGLVKFANNATTLISIYDSVSYYVMPPNDGTVEHTFYFAFLSAPLGTTDPAAFTFTGLYATNVAATTGGRLQGGSLLGVAVDGWAWNESRSYEIAGWPAVLGHDWQQGWLTARPINGFGVSSIGQGAPFYDPTVLDSYARLFRLGRHRR